MKGKNLGHQRAISKPPKVEIPEFVGPLYSIPKKYNDVSPMRPRVKSAISVGKKFRRPKSAARASLIGSSA